MIYLKKHSFVLALIVILILSLSSCSNNIQDNKSINDNNDFENISKEKSYETNSISGEDTEMQLTKESTINTNQSKPIENSDILEKPIIEKAYEIPDGFVYIDDIIPYVVIDAKYSTTDNFVGQVVDGYEANLAILSTEAAFALSLVQEDLNENSLGLKIFDGYRPQKAVDNFVEWASDKNDLTTKEEHYPDLDKSTLIPSGYIASKSGHSRGSTVDLTIVNLETLEELDMGTEFDFLGVQSHFAYENLSETQKENRKLLKSTMENHGFKYYKNEWWHYTLINEPYKDIYFDFDVK
jgi:D-alanyl-D-alanine dipeptidase